MKASRDKMRAAITANRGGLAEATDDQLGMIWASLPEATRAGYLKSIKPDKPAAGARGES